MINTSHIWQFSDSSKMQLERCIAAAQFDSQNKWIQKFKITQTITQHSGQVAEVIDEDSAECIKVQAAPIETINVIHDEKHIDFIQEVVDGDPIAYFNNIVDMCLQDKNVYSLLLNNLSPLSLKKLCDHIFSTTDVNREFLENFYKNFLPNYLKKEHTLLSLDILVKAKECHSEEFNTLLLILLNEKDFPSNILQEFVSTLNLNELKFFLSNIVEHDLSNEMFVHHMYTIFVAYKECPKDENVQNYILKKLAQISGICSNDKNYGRFLLHFIQTYKTTGNFTALEKLVETHRSAFKRPCINALDTFKENIE